TASAKRRGDDARGEERDGGRGGVWCEAVRHPLPAIDEPMVGGPHPRVRDDRVTEPNRREPVITEETTERRRREVIEVTRDVVVTPVRFEHASFDRCEVG